MKLIKIKNIYINIDKIINVYETEQLNATLTVIEIEGIQTDYYDDEPVYRQNKIYTDLPIEDVISLITNA